MFNFLHHFPQQNNNQKPVLWYSIKFRLLYDNIVIVIT